MPGRGRNAVQYVQNDEPSFIKQFKEKIGYKEGPGVDTKRQQLEYEADEDAPEREDEQPVVVVLKDGDLTAEQAKQAKEDQENTAANVDDVTADGKITFKKPVKRSSEDVPTSDLSVSTGSKKKKDNDKKSKTSGKKVKNSSLLSFGDDEEEDD